jgi:hypothetical protein
MIQRKQIIGATAFFVVMALTVGFFALAADIGGKENPLVTLDYLKSLDPQIEETIGAAVRAQVDAQITDFQALIQQAHEAAGTGGPINMDELLHDQDFINRVASAIAGQIGTGTGDLDAVAQRVVVESGKTLHLPMGSSVVLRLGTGTVQASNSPGLIDVTAGTTLDNGGVLAANHKYFVSMEAGRDIRCSAQMTVFIWGPYVIS